MEYVYSFVDHLNTNLGVALLGSLGAIFASIYRFRRRRLDNEIENSRKSLDADKKFALQLQKYIASRHSTLKIVIECLGEPNLRQTRNWKVYMKAVRNWNRLIVPHKKQLIALQNSLDNHAAKSLPTLGSILYNSAQDEFWESVASNKADIALEDKDNLPTPDCIHFGFWLAHRHVHAALESPISVKKREQGKKAAAAHIAAQNNWTLLSRRITAALRYGDARIAHLESLPFRRVMFARKFNQLIDVPASTYIPPEEITDGLSPDGRSNIGPVKLERAA